jgi:hypothetical protein
MRLRPFCLFVATLPLGAIAWAASPTDPDPLAARNPVDPSSAIDTAAAQRAMHSALGTSSSAPHGILPDPVLLDGSTQAAEKKPAYGMLGEFEIPGDDNGGQNDSSKQNQQQQQQQGGSSGSKSQDQKSQQSSGGSQSQSGQQGGGGQSGQQGGGGGQSQSGQQGGGGSQSQSGQQQGGGGGSSDKIDQSQSGGGDGDQSADASQSGGGGQSSGKAGGGSRSASRSGSKSSKGGSGGGSVGQSDPNASSDGAAESSGLSAQEGGELASQGDAMPAKPGEMKIGDATMQIKTQTASPTQSVVGVQQPVGKEVPQEYGRMAAGQPQSNTNVNHGVEKGQTMPTGL